MTGEVTGSMLSSRPRLFALLAGVVLLVAGGGLVVTLAARALTGVGAPSQTHNGNVSVYDQTSVIQGTVRGNLSVQNDATVTVTGHVTGWLRAYGTSSVILASGARVDGGILQSTGTLRVLPGAWVGKAVSTYNLSDQADLGGHVAGPVRISASGLELGPQAQVAGDVWVWATPAQPVQVDGTVDGSVHVSGTDLRLGRTSHIGGSTVVNSGRVTHT